MAHKVQYGVKFVGYTAEVIRKGCDGPYARLDFLTGYASVHADQGWVSSKRADLGSFVRSLPKLITELQQRLSQRLDETDFSRVSETVHISCGGNEICVAPGVDARKFIRQVAQRFLEIEAVLEQAELAGSRIKRRPYDEYIDEIGKTGVCRVEVHGGGLYVDGKLIFYPDYQVFFVKPLLDDDSLDSLISASAASSARHRA